jgi:hypothetical protein
MKGSSNRGAQNLPGDWTSSKFNLPLILCEAIPRIGEDETSIAKRIKAVAGPSAITDEQHATKIDKVPVPLDSPLT